MCDRIAIIDKGDLVALDTTRKLLDRIQTKKVTFRIEKNKNFEELKLKGVKFISGSKDTVTAIYEKNLISFEFILGFLKVKRKYFLGIKSNELDTAERICSLGTGPNSDILQTMLHFGSRTTFWEDFRMIMHGFA